METRANHLLIGAVTLALLFGAFGFALWLAGIGNQPNFDRYVIFFDSAVDGLGEGSDVRYNGIKVGSVGKITLDKENPSRVKVEIDVANDTPIRKDSVAELNTQGITGIAYVQISSGQGPSPLLDPDAGRPPIIPSRAGGLAEIVATLPEVLRQASELLRDAKIFVGPENQAMVAKILSDLSVVTGAIAGRAPEIGKIIDNLNATMNSAESALDAVEAITQDAKSAMAAIDKFADSLRDLVVSNRRSIDEFAAEGLTQFVRFIAEARQLVAILERIGQSLESDPGRFLLGTQRPEYAPK